MLNTVSAIQQIPLVAQSVVVLFLLEDTVLVDVDTLASMDIILVHSL